MFEHVLVPQPTDKGTAILTRAFKAAMSAPNPQAAVNALLSTLGPAFSAQRAYIYQLPPEGEEFLCTYEWCAPGIEPMTDVTHGLTRQMASRWFDDGEPRSLLAIRDVAAVAKVNPQYAALFAPRNMQTQILGKLLRGQQPLGVLGFDDPDPQAFDDICQLMFPICAFATSALNSANILSRMHAVGMVDKLTGAGTRMGFYHKAEHLPHDIPLGVAYFDIAGLQAVNDVRGHDAGDQLLIAVRQILSAEFKDDQVFRVAGDEFLVAVPGMPEHLLRTAVARIRLKLEELSAYVAVGIAWKPATFGDYDPLVRQAWIECDGDKKEWERRGGKRLESTYESRGLITIAADKGHEGDSHLDIPCYHNDEFFRRAHIWATHTETERIGLIAFDINYFKLYNDIFGREAGDVMLETYGQTLAMLAAQAHGVAGYLGGDNFALAFPVPSHLNVEIFSKQVDAQLSKYAVAEGFSPVMGIVITDNPDVGMTILYDRALVALEEIKGSYTEHVSFYDEGRYERERETQLLLMQAQEGIANEEFTFYLQPKVDISTNKVVSAEALVRWIRGDEVVPPFKFIGPMEHSGYIFALDRYIWESVCKWQRSLIDRSIKPVPVSVNVSRVDFYFTDLADHFLSLVKKYDIPARLIGIEVTESAYSKDTDLINDVIRRMQRNGFLVFMDDFGSGYSSLNMLRSVAVDVLKMDKGFIDNADIHDGSDAIISNVIKMAHMMGLPVISEGVETEEQCDSLRRMDCDYVQGYYYYRPMAIKEFEKMLCAGETVELDHKDKTIFAMSNSHK